MRGNRPYLRQGALNAIDEKTAIDRVYEMGRKVWKRTVLEVTIIEPSNGEVISTSKIGDEVSQHLLPYINDGNNFEDNKEDDDKSGFVPWNQPTSIFVAGSIGTHFTPETFARLTGFDK